MKKRILSIALVVVMIVAMIPAMLLPTAAFTWEDGYDAAIVTDGAITVDGAATPDAAYLNGEKIVSRNQVVTGNANGETNEFIAYAAADDNGLYLWTKITDQSLDKGDGYEKVVGTDEETGDDIYDTANIAVSSGDKFQIYLRASSDAGRAYGTYEMDYINQIASSAAYGVFDKDSITRSIQTYAEEDAWVVEVYLPWTSLATEFEGQTTDDIQVQIGLQTCNYTVSWDTTKNNGAGGEATTAKAYSYDNRFGGSYYRGMYGHTYATSDNASGWMGSLCTPLNFSGLDVPVVADAIAVDGKMDAAYAKAEKAGCYAATGIENFAAYTIASLDGLYIYVDIIDNTLDKKSFEDVTLGDKFQVYFQMGNRYSHNYWGYIEMDYRAAEECEGTGTKVNYRYFQKADWLSTTRPDGSNFTKGEMDIAHATSKKFDAQGNALGWTAELFIPWYGEMAFRNMDELATQTVSLGFQVNDETLKAEYNTPETYKGDGSHSRISLCYSNRDGGKYYLLNNSSNVDGTFFFTPVRFVFDNAPMQIERWAKYVDEITLDGIKDEVYSEYAVDFVDYVYVSGSGRDPERDPESGYYLGGQEFVIGKGYYAFTDTDMYVYFEVYDDTVAPDGENQEYACIYYYNSVTSSKWNLGPDQSYNTNGTYWGEKVVTDAADPADNTYPPIDPSTLSNGVNLALSYYTNDDTTPSKTNYDYYAVEFKMPLPEAEKTALAEGELVTVGIGLEVNDSKADGTRHWYGYSAPSVSAIWNGGWYCFNMPKVRLDKNLTDASFDVTPEITAAQVALGESINMNYFATLPLNATDAKMKFTFNGEEFFANAAVTEVANEYVFTFTGIAPQCMGDNIKAELIVDGEVVATKDNYSVFQNCLNLALADQSNAKLIALIGDLGAYGAAAQLYANYKTDSLVNEGYSHFATGLKPTSGFEKTLTEAPEMFNFTAAGVYFDNTNKLYAKMFIDAEAMASGSMEVTVNGVKATFEPTGNENEYIVYTGEILVTEFADTYTFVISDGLDSQTLEYSVNSYCQAKYANATRPEAATLAAATYAYGVSAVAYAG